MKLENIIRLLNGNLYDVYNQCPCCGEEKLLSGKIGTIEEMDEEDILKRYGEDKVVELVPEEHKLRIVVQRSKDK